MHSHMCIDIPPIGAWKKSEKCRGIIFHLMISFWLLKQCVFGETVLLCVYQWVFPCQYEQHSLFIVGVDGEEQLQVSNVLWPVRWMEKHYLLISITKSLKALLSCCKTVKRGKIFSDSIVDKYYNWYFQVWLTKKIWLLHVCEWV